MYAMHRWTKHVFTIGLHNKKSDNRKFSSRHQNEYIWDESKSKIELTKRHKIIIVAICVRKKGLSIRGILCVGLCECVSVCRWHQSGARDCFFVFVINRAIDGAGGDVVSHSARKTSRQQAIRMQFRRRDAASSHSRLIAVVADHRKSRFCVHKKMCPSMYLRIFRNAGHEKKN